MAKRVNTPSPLLLMGFFLCVIGTGILGFLYYDLSETYKRLEVNDKKQKDKIVELAESNTDLIKKHKLEISTVFGPSYETMTPKDFDLHMLNYFKERTKEGASEQDQIKLLRDQGINIAMIEEKIAIADQKIAEISKKYEADIKEHAAANEKLKEEYEAVVDDLESKIESQKTDIDTLMATKNVDISKLTKEKEALEVQLNDSREETALTKSVLNQVQQEKTKIVSEYENEVFRLSELLRKKEEIAHYKRELEEDGQIINTEATLRTGVLVVNLGKRDRISRGMKFIVYRMDNGGTQKIKGEIIIRRVDEHTSLAGISSVEDVTDPIVKGDLLANTVYKKDGKYNFFLIGTFENYSRNELKRLIEKDGSKVVDELHASTVDYVVVGNFSNKTDDDQNELFKRSMRFNLNTMNEDEIRTFLRDYSQ